MARLINAPLRQSMTATTEPVDSDMTSPETTSTAVPQSFAQQDAGFTTATTLPPSKVFTISPATDHPVQRIEDLPVTRVQGTIKLKRASQARYP
jgi:hypothetical protein